MVRYKRVWVKPHLRKTSKTWLYKGVKKTPFKVGIKGYWKKVKVKK